MVKQMVDDLSLMCQSNRKVGDAQLLRSSVQDHLYMHCVHGEFEWPVDLCPHWIE